MKLLHRRAMRWGLLDQRGAVGHGLRKRVQQEFDRNRIGGAGAAGKARPAGIARLVSGSSSSSIVSAGFIVATMLLPDGVTAAAVGSSVIWKILVAPSKIEASPSTWKVNTGAPITTTRSWPRNASESCAGEACKKPANCGCRSGKLTARRKRADPHGGSGLLRNAHHQVDGLRAIDGGADHEGRALARERGGERFHRAGSGPSSRLTCRASSAGSDGSSRRPAPRRKSVRTAAASQRNRRARSPPARLRPGRLDLNLT